MTRHTHTPCALEEDAGVGDPWDSLALLPDIAASCSHPKSINHSFLACQMGVGEGEKIDATYRVGGQGGCNFLPQLEKRGLLSLPVVWSREERDSNRHVIISPSGRVQVAYKCAKHHCLHLSTSSGDWFSWADRLQLSNKR